MAGGRPTKYREEYNEQAFKLCLLGATDQDLANFFEVEEKTINTWKQKHPEFLQALKDGKEDADAKVAQSLYSRAIGYEAKPEIKEELDEAGTIVKTTKTVKTVGPDTTAAIFWLKNRKSDKWRDKQEVAHSGDGISFNLNFGEKDAD